MTRRSPSRKGRSRRGAAVPTPRARGFHDRPAPWRRPSSACLTQIDAQAANVEEREAERHEEDHDGECCAITELQVLEQRVECVHRDRLGGRPRTTACEDVDQVEYSKGIERTEDERNED